MIYLFNLITTCTIPVKISQLTKDKHYLINSDIWILYSDIWIVRDPPWENSE